MLQSHTGGHMEPGYTQHLSEAEIRLTPSAREKMAELQGSTDEEISGIRLFVSGGGCGGMTYGMTYADELTEYDSVLQGAGFQLIVDAVALNYLQGCEIDFVDGPNPSFAFNNVFQTIGGTGACGGCAGSGSF